jgi:hypothetical protein
MISVSEIEKLIKAVDLYEQEAFAATASEDYREGIPMIVKTVRKFIAAVKQEDWQEALWVIKGYRWQVADAPYSQPSIFLSISNDIAKIERQIKQHLLQTQTA